MNLWTKCVFLIFKIFLYAGCLFIHKQYMCKLLKQGLFKYAEFSTGSCKKELFDMTRYSLGYECEFSQIYIVISKGLLIIKSIYSRTVLCCFRCSVIVADNNILPINRFGQGSLKVIHDVIYI